MNDFRLPAQTHIGYAHLNTANLARSLSFYADKMGFQQIGHDGDTVTLSADGHTPHILLTEQPTWKPKPRSTGLYHVAIRLPNRESLARVFKRLVSFSYPFGGFSDHLVSEALYLNDPDGNGLELYCDRPRDEWQYVDGQVQMSLGALDVDKLLREADDTPWTAIDPATDIGHVHLHIADLQQAKAFYADLLGFELSVDWTGQGVIFVAAGGYHHHIGLNIWGGQQPQPPETLGLRSFSINVPDADTLNQLCERLHAAAVKVEKQVDDSLLVHDPVGNAVMLVNKK
ncbi:MAG: VOC family protein [Anaerolineae bacterium]|nr:VOC family protein [Anaerolineae bacterium]